MSATDELLEKLRMLKYDYDSMSTSLEDAIDDIAYELEQAIAATLGSDREAELEALVRELWHLVNNRSGYGYAAALERIEALGIEVEQ